MMSNLLNSNSCPLTPSDTYSDTDEASNLSELSSVYKNEYCHSPPESVQSDNLHFNQLQYNNNNNAVENSNDEKVHGQENNVVYQAYGLNNYQHQHQYDMQQKNYDGGYQQGVNNELIQPYSIANFNFTSEKNYNPQNLNNESPDENKENFKEEFNENDERNLQLKQDEVDQKEGSNLSNALKIDFLMQPPDSESIAAAAVTARRNKNKRRTRTKFDSDQLDLLEAAFQRTHYPDVNVIDRLAEVLRITTEKVSVWFQNRRARYKRAKKPKNHESECKTDENPLDLIEAANQELIEKRRIANEKLFNESENYGNDSLNTSNKDNNYNKRKSQNIENLSSFVDSEDSNSCPTKPELTNINQKTEEYLKIENSNYTSPAYEMYQNMPPAVTIHNNQSFYSQQLFEQNQFYQQDYKNKLPVSPVASENRSSPSIVNTSESRSGSPADSESSVSPDTSENSHEQQNEESNYNIQNSNYNTEPQLYNNDNLGYPYLHGHNMFEHMRGPPIMNYHHQNSHHQQVQQQYQQDQNQNQQNFNNFSAENLYRQNFAPQVTPQHLPVTPQGSNIFQPYADCNKDNTESSADASDTYNEKIANHPYHMHMQNHMQNISHFNNNPMPYYQSY